MQHPFSTKALIDWLKTKPPEATYDYQAVRSCLIAQYFQHLGFEAHVASTHVYMWGPSTGPGNEQKLRLRPDWNDIAMLEPHTFGAALQRASLLNTQAELRELRQLDLLAKELA